MKKNLKKKGKLLSIAKDCEVEVYLQEDGFKGSWFRAILEQNPTRVKEKKLRVCYITLFNEDGANPCKETIERCFIRPVPPECLNEGVLFKEGSVVDAYFNNGWWTGLIVLGRPDGSFFVYFDDPPDIMRFIRSQLRPHADWIGSEWVKSKNKVLFSLSSPPRDLCAEYSMNDYVEVVVTHGWRKGRVTEILLENNYKVYFAATKEDAIFNYTEIRLSIEWLGGGIWIKAHEREFENNAATPIRLAQESPSNTLVLESNEDDTVDDDATEIKSSRESHSNTSFLEATETETQNHEPVDGVELPLPHESNDMMDDVATPIIDPQEIPQDCEVEVSLQEDGFKGSWFRAILEQNPTRVRGKKLQGVVFKEGSVVDSYFNNGWWTGLIVVERPDGRFLVYFDDPPDIMRFIKSQLRPHADWIGSEWVKSKNKVLNKSLEQGTEGKHSIVDICKIRPSPPQDLCAEYSLNDYVEVVVTHGWRKGRVTEILLENNYRVYFAATKEDAIFNYTEIMLSMEWLGGGSWIKAHEGVELPLSHESDDMMDDVATPIIDPQEIPRDCEVEVSLQEDGFKGSRFRAILEQNPVRVKGKKLRERSVVDAYFNNGWWTGLVVVERPDGSFLVYFDDPPYIMRFIRSQLRPHADWIDSEWVKSKNTYSLNDYVEVVGTHGWRKGRVTEILLENNYKVYFAATKEDAIFNYTEITLSIEWLGGGSWIKAHEGVELPLPHESDDMMVDVATPIIDPQQIPRGKM
ncbi:hypothetical protein F2Q69_00049880 [Brassica cretica]|uniref:Agenet domain-containing protein n=1 Tax=Brassica cretica TaxID=69181 RepID=A0A8S9PW41_BRACR|nr:hypothetical protein F2Q69_00049880 [Brassica cretica]